VTPIQKKRLPKILLLAAILLALGGSIFLRLRSEPKYHGKSVSYWFHEYCRSGLQMIYDPTRHEEAADALRHLGTNAVPYLVGRSFAPGYAAPNPPRIQQFFNGLLRALGLPQIITAQVMGDDAPIALTDIIKPPAGQLLPLLKEHLQSGDRFERCQSMFILGTVGGDAGLVVPFLQAGLNDKDSRTRLLALQSLGWLGPRAEAAVPTLLALLNNPGNTNHSVSDIAIALGKIGTSNTAPAVPFVKRLFEKETVWGRRCSYAAALLRMDAGQSDALAFLTNGLLTHPSANDRWIAARNLGEIGSNASPAIPALLQALGRTNVLLLALIPHTLQSVGVPAATFLPIMKEHLKVTDDSILFNTASAILEFDPADNDAQQVLIALIKNESTYQNLAIDLLGRVGPSAKAALPVLRQAAGKNSPPGQKPAILKAIQRIEAKETAPR
jgi:HEAT repeat protein